MDVHSLFPCNGISDGIIDFFIWLDLHANMHIVLKYNLYSTMLDPCEHITFLSAQTYSSVCCALKLRTQAEKEIVRIHRACNHSVSLSKRKAVAIAAIPCKLS